MDIMREQPKGPRAPVWRLPPGHVDDLDRLTAVSSLHPVSHRPRALLGFMTLLVIVVTLGIVCARGPRPSIGVDPAHVLPTR